MLYSDWPLVWTLYYLERKCIRLKFVIEGWLAGPWRPQRWSLPWSSCAVRTCPRGFLELLLLLVVLWAAAELRSMRTTPRRQGDPRVQRISQQQSNFSDFLLKIWAVQQFNKSSLLERETLADDANYWKSLCLSNFYEILYIIQLENKSQTVQHFVGSPGGFLCCVRTETRLISRDLTARLKLAEPLTALLLRRSSSKQRRAAKSYSSIFLPALMCKLYSL